MSMITGQIEELRNLADDMEKSGQGISAKYVRNSADTIEDLSAKLEEKNVGWIFCNERLPEEHDSIFLKFKGTDKWKDEMFERTSENVLVTVAFDNGNVATEVSHTLDGKWRFDPSILKRNVIAWMPLPEPYKEG